MGANFIELGAGLRQRPAALAGLMIVLLLALLAIAAPWIAPHDPVEQFRDALLSPPW